MTKEDAKPDSKSAAADKDDKDKDGNPAKADSRAKSDNKDKGAEDDKSALRMGDDNNTDVNRKADVNDGLGDLQSTDYPLTITVLDEDGREIHRTQLGQNDRLNSDDFVSPDLDARFPGKKTVRVHDATDKLRYERG